MTNDSVKLAQLWLNLKDVKEVLDNDLIPVGGYLGVDDEELMTAMANLSREIGNHFTRFKLSAGAAEPKE